MGRAPGLAPDQRGIRGSGKMRRVKRAGSDIRVWLRDGGSVSKNECTVFELDVNGLTFERLGEARRFIPRSDITNWNEIQGGDQPPPADPSAPPAKWLYNG